MAVGALGTSECRRHLICCSPLSYHPASGGNYCQVTGCHMTHSSVTSHRVSHTSGSSHVIKKIKHHNTTQIALRGNVSSVKISICLIKQLTLTVGKTGFLWFFEQWMMLKWRVSSSLLILIVFPSLVKPAFSVHCLAEQKRKDWSNGPCPDVSPWHNQNKHSRQWLGVWCNDTHKAPTTWGVHKAWWKDPKDDWMDNYMLQIAACGGYTFISPHFLSDRNTRVCNFWHLKDSHESFFCYSRLQSCC